jgi:hypothetical protein
MVGFTRSDDPVYGVRDAQVDIVILCRSVVVARGPGRTRDSSVRSVGKVRGEETSESAVA